MVAAGDTVEERRPGTRHRLHEDLALLMSTSGSTGSPKLVRLSHENLRANADSIATYLSITPDDRAATTLPLHYCYGLSVLNSHLLVGASLLVTERSVVDDEFWDDFRASRATSFAGVPHTFDLLDAAGFAARHLPSLRYVTQAGGRLAPEKVRRYAALGRQRGFDLVVMYGQTEATARMAYLPAHLAEARPEAIGIPVPGGSLRIDTGSADARDGVGELVYTGPNVMLGYASGPRDLAAGRVVHELRTGDLARQHEDGIFELVGRNSRFAKVFGLRIDLDRVERIAAERGLQARAVEHDGKLVLFVTRHLDLASLDSVAVLCGVPPAGLTRLVVSSFPATSSGKPDYASLTRHAAVVERSARQGTVRAAPEAADVRDLLAELLGRPDATVEDSFVDLRGDSLSYVEVSVRLGDLLGPLPSDWPERSCSELTRAPAPRPPSRPGRWRSGHVETSVALRAAAIFLIVATHANLITVMGGAHLMLGLVGFNLARFQLSGRHRRDRARDLVRAAAQVAVPAGIWILGVGFVTGMYRPATALMLNNLVGSRVWDVQWQFWFLEAAVWSQALVAGLVLLPWVDTWERRRPYAFAVGVLAVTLTLRYVLVGVVAGPTERYALPVVLWCIALGWLVARSTTTSGALVDVRAGRRCDVRILRRRRARRSGRWRPPLADLAAACRGTAPAARPGHEAGRLVAVRLPHPLAGLPAPGDGPPPGGHPAVARSGRGGVEVLPRRGRTSSQVGSPSTSAMACVGGRESGSSFAVAVSVPPPWSLRKKSRHLLYGSTFSQAPEARLLMQAGEGPGRVGAAVERPPEGPTRRASR